MSHSEWYKELFKNNIEYQETELYTTFIVPFDEEFIKTNYEKKYQTLFLNQKHQHQKKYKCTKIEDIFLIFQHQREKQVYHKEQQQA